MANKISRCLHWFRNDLRLDDNLALAKSLEYDQVIALLVESVKELKAEIEELKKHK